MVNVSIKIVDAKEVRGENNMKESMYESLLNQYKMKPEEELLQITIENGYTEDAEKAAKYILSSNRADYKAYIQQKDNLERRNDEMYQARVDNPLYEDIHQLAGDIRFIKNLIIVMLVIAVLASLFVGFQIGKIL